MGHFGHPATHAQRGRNELVDAQQLKTDCRSAHIDDSIDGADFVKMNFLDWLVVNATFSLSQPGENLCRPVPNTPVQPRIVNNLENVAEVPVRVLGRCLDPSVSRAASRAMNLLEIQRPTRDPEKLQLFNHRAP